MAERIKRLLQRLRLLLASPWGRRIKLALAILVGGTALYGVGRQLWQGAGAIDWAHTTIDWTLLWLAVLLALVSQFLGGIVWHLLLRGVGHRLSLLTCATIHSSSNLVKYIPGYAWQILGKAYLTRQKEVPARAITVALAIEFGGLIGTALLASGLLLTSEAVKPPLAVPASVRWGGIALTSAVLIATPWLVRLSSPQDDAQPRPGLLASAGWIWSAFLVMLVAWVLLGHSTSLIAQSVSAPAPGLWSAGTVALAISFVISFAVFFVPAGIGVRESALTWLLSGSVGGGVAALTAIISRLSLTVAELLAFGLLWLARSSGFFNNQSITQRGEVPKGPCARSADQCEAK